VDQGWIRGVLGALPGLFAHTVSIRRMWTGALVHKEQTITNMWPGEGGGCGGGCEHWYTLSNSQGTSDQACEVELQRILYSCAALHRDDRQVAAAERVQQVGAPGGRSEQQIGNVVPSWSS